MAEYDRAKREYKANEQIKSDIRSKIFAITDKDVNAKFFKKRSAMPKTFYKLLEGKYSDKNPLNLDGDKLAEMLKIDTTILFSLMKSVEQIEEPIIETYQKFAESEAELKRLNNARHLIERINAMDVKIQPFNIIRSTIPQCIEFDMRNNILVPSVAYVKGTEKRGM